MAKLWRNSASLIVLAQNQGNLFNKGYNYKIHLFTRSAKTSFMPKSCVFPGGAFDDADKTTEWLKHFQNFGIPDSKLTELANIGGKRPTIFDSSKSDVLREISLRICAIRETFEEVGILICRKKDELSFVNNDNYGKFREDFDRKKWQQIVHDEPKRFLELCQTLEVIPDLWSLYEWSAWLTPTPFSRRFETAFFLVGLKSLPNLIAEENEVQDVYWKTPDEYFESFQNEELWLPPPQCYELGRLRNIQSLDELINFAKNRSQNGVVLSFPVTYTCSDGSAGVLPGDDMYPVNPHDITDPIIIAETLDKFRKKSKLYHRIEYQGLYKNQIYINFPPPYGHLIPKTGGSVSVVKSKL